MGTDTAKEKQVTRPLKIHSEDWDMARDFNRAAYFTAHLRCGREFAMTIRDLPTYEAAQEAAAKLEADHATYGRKALIYAVIEPGGYSILATPEVVHCAGELA